MLVVEDEVGLAKLVRQGLRTEGMLADVAVTRRGRAVDGRGLARTTRSASTSTCRGSTASRPAVGCAPTASPPDPHAHRARRRRRPDHRPRHRRRRLPRQAVRLRRAGRAAARAHAAAGRPWPPRCSRSATSSSTSHAARAPRGPGRAAVGQGGPGARGLHAPPGRGHLPLPAARGRLGHRLRAPLQRDRGLRPLPAREARPAVRAQQRSRPSAARATACAPTDQAARQAAASPRRRRPARFARPHRAALRLDERGDERQAEAGAGAVRAVGILDEALEGVREERRREARALVGDDEGDAAPALGSSRARSVTAPVRRGAARWRRRCRAPGRAGPGRRGRRRRPGSGRRR